MSPHHFLSLYSKLLPLKVQLLIRIIMGDLHSACLNDCSKPPTASRPILHLRPYHHCTKTHTSATTDATINESSNQITTARITFHTDSPPMPEPEHNDSPKEIIDSRSQMEKWICHIYEDVLVFGQKGTETKETQAANNNIEDIHAQTQEQWIRPQIKVVIPSVIRSSVMQKWKGSRFQSSAFFVDIDYNSIFEKC